MNELILKERFFRNVKIGNPNECWEWPLSKDGDGYGRIFIKGKKYRAHRLTWMVFQGPIPQGFHVCHHCDNPPCVNPHHLFIGTNYDNLMDSVRKGRHRIPNNPTFGSNHGLTTLTENQVLQIREEYRGGQITQLSLAKKYNVGRSTIGRIVNREYWTHI